MKNTIERTVSDDIADCARAIAGLDVEAVCAGPGVELSEVTSVVGDRFAINHAHLKVPVLSRLTIPDDAVRLVYVRSPQESRWCDFGLKRSSLVSEGPGCEHTARIDAGTDFVFAIIECTQLEERADRLNVRLTPQRRGEVQLLGSTAKVDRAGAALSRFADVDDTGETVPWTVADDIVSATVLALSEDDPVRSVRPSKWIDSRHVVHACIDYAESIQRIPSISELCLASHVSERRMREAFTEEYDLPPSQFFRLWALTEAHRRLTGGTGCRDTVTDIAVALGFDHLGRFAGHYKNLYGESPSTTLRRHDSHAHSA